ncbi:MAG: hypothetical protein HYT15_01135 [Candidatus Magasanikbacteria bacterium]|nr:hypothetical protein [Candidatus Magasanikbacteria bacterium]
MLPAVDRIVDRLLGSDNQVPPLRQVSSTVPRKVMVVLDVNLEQWIEVAKERGAYQKVHIGTSGIPRPPWHPDNIPVARFSMPDPSSAWSVVRAVSFNQRVSMDEVKGFIRFTHLELFTTPEYYSDTASAFEHIALDIQYPEVTDGLSIISFDKESCSPRLVSCGPTGNRELFVGPFIPNMLRSENTHWLLR